MGTTAGEHIVAVTMIQMVSQDDLPFEKGHDYRIELNFEGSPII